MSRERFLQDLYNRKIDSKIIGVISDLIRIRWTYSVTVTYQSKVNKLHFEDDLILLRDSLFEKYKCMVHYIAILKHMTNNSHAHILIWIESPVFDLQEHHFFSDLRNRSNIEIKKIISGRHSFKSVMYLVKRCNTSETEEKFKFGSTLFLNTYETGIKDSDIWEYYFAPCRAWDHFKHSDLKDCIKHSRKLRKRFKVIKKTPEREELRSKQAFEGKKYSNFV